MRVKISLPVTLFGVGCLLNYVWEVGQMVAMVVPDPQAQPLWRACIPATLFDGGMVLLLYLGGIRLFGDCRWILRPGLAGTAYLLVTGATLGVLIELYGVKWNRQWGYTAAMPLLPWIGVGLLPILQMSLLPLASALLVRAALSKPLFPR